MGAVKSIEGVLTATTDRRFQSAAASIAPVPNQTPTDIAVQDLYAQSVANTSTPNPDAEPFDAYFAVLGIKKVI